MKIPDDDVKILTPKVAVLPAILCGQRAREILTAMNLRKTTFEKKLHYNLHLRCFKNSNQKFSC